MRRPCLPIDRTAADLLEKQEVCATRLGTLIDDEHEDDDEDDFQGTYNPAPVAYWPKGSRDTRAKSAPSAGAQSTMKTDFPGFSPEALKFFVQLKRHNNRPWFLKNKETYERQIKEPMLSLVLEINSELRGLAPELVTEPKRAIYRIYRDVRFSADKSPYKTHTAALFAPRGLGKHACSGLYFHFSPDELLVAGGVYMPGPKELLAIRNHIAANPKALRIILAHRQFAKLFGRLEGDQLARVPKGFAPEHPAADLLRYKQFLAWIKHPPELALSQELLPTLVQTFDTLMPLVRFLNAPLKPVKKEMIA